MVTPFISQIKNQGGTFYQFQSAIEDFNFNISTTNKEFKFSKFVCLNLPNQKDGSSGINTSLVSNQPTTFLKSDGEDLNLDFAQSFQNYCLNLESMLLNQPTYDESKNLTVSERVFWKWLKETGAIRFREANVGNPEDGGERTRKLGTTSTGKRFVEEDSREAFVSGFYPYSRVVQYIGNIDAINSVKYLGSGFTELYLMMPVETGNIPKVLFKSILDDPNYAPNMTLTHRPANSLDAETILGRSYNDTHPLGLDIRAYFDSDTDTLSSGTIGVDSYSLNIKLNGEDSYESGWWFPTNPSRNSYMTDKELNDWRNDWCKVEGYKNSVATEREFLRSRLDGISIDFDLQNSYSDNLTGKFKTFEDYAKSTLSSDFEFNAVLVYYDLIDKTDSSKSVTNLYGVWFVDKWKDTLTDGWKIEPYKKFKPNSVNRQNGNSYAWKINLKLDLNAQDNVPITSVNEYNNFSMHLFMDALNSMKTTHDRLIENINGLKLLQDKIDTLEDRIAEEETLADLGTRLTNLEDSLTTNQSLLSNTKNVISLIDRNYQEILNIYKNFTSVQMSYNLDVLKEGRGIEFDKTVSGRIKLNSINDGYNIPTDPIVSYENLNYNPKDNFIYYTHKLQPYNNYIKFKNTTNTPIYLDRGQTFRLYIEDSIDWKKGQVVRISFGDQFIFNNNSKALTVLTDSRNLTKSNNPYSIECGVLSTLDFNSKSNKPIIEIICVDNKKMIFTFDIL